MSQPGGCAQAHAAAINVTKTRYEVVTLSHDWSPGCGRSGAVLTQWWEALATGGVTLSAQGTGWAQVSLGTPGLVYPVVSTVVVAPGPTGYLPSTVQQAFQVYVQPQADLFVGTPCSCP